MNFKHLHYFWVTAKAGGVMRVVVVIGILA